MAASDEFIIELSTLRMRDKRQLDIDFLADSEYSKQQESEIRRFFYCNIEIERESIDNLCNDVAVTKTLMSLYRVT